MIANARLYSVTPQAAAAWRALLVQIAQRAGEPLEVLEYPAPAPLPQLWARADKGAVFMCGLPFSRSSPRPHLVAAPVPSPPAFQGRAQYWSEFVVRADSPHQELGDTFGGRIAFTSVQSQSGFAAPLQHLRAFAERAPLFAHVVAPQVSPQGAMTAVSEGVADVAAIDSYSMQLLQRYNASLVTRVRVVARTEPRPIPPLVACAPAAKLSAAFLSAHDEPQLSSYLSELLLERFVLPSAATYEVLGEEFDHTLACWREHPLATQIHPAFQGMLIA